LRTTRSTFALRWIGPECFRGRCQTNRPIAQDLLRIAREGLLDIKVRRQSRIRFTNALRTTRSTFALRWIGPERFRGRCQTNRPNEQDLLRIAREALLDIKFRRQSRIRFTNALRTTRSTRAKGGSDATKITA